MKKMKTGGLEQALEKAVCALASTIEYRDPFTAAHQVQVTRLACRLAKELNLSAERTTGLRVAGIIHDLGKVYLPVEIASKPCPLTPAEMEIVMGHPQLGCDIIKEVKFPWPVQKIILQHHERLDGSGYPRGLKGRAIILESRIMAVADVMQAIVSQRPYRPGLGLNRAREVIIEGRGARYDPEVVDACLDLFKRKRFSFDRP
ncbi:MAG TPA: HD-GYP domain-containing protein [bacterium]|nr:HD-GYP domain-containing protein [bacterium]